VLYHDEKVAAVQKPRNLYDNFLQLNFFDSLFQQYEVAAITFSDTANLRKLQITFKPGSPYFNYTLYYERTSYYATKMIFRRYDDRFVEAQPSPPFNYVEVIVELLNYQTFTPPPGFFNTETYIKRKLGVFAMEQPYTDYEIFDAYSEQQPNY
jgi:hypothetical protein